MRGDKHLKTALITPAYSRHRKLLDVACGQVDRFCPDGVDHIILVSAKEMSLFRHLESPRRHVLVIEEVMGQLFWRAPVMAAGREYYFYKRHYPVPGWTMQQIVKLAAPDYTEAELLIYLDTDVFMIRPFRMTDFVQEGRVRLLRKPETVNGSQRRWYRKAERLLGLDGTGAPHPDYIGGFVSWRRDVCMQLRQTLEQNWQRPWLDIMARQGNFSEYILYGTFADRVLAQPAQKHFATERELCLCSWDFRAGLDLEQEFLRAMRPQYIAINIQSNLKLPFAQYCQVLAGVAAQLEQGAAGLEAVQTAREQLESEKNYSGN